MFSLFHKGEAAPETVMPGAQRSRRMSLEERMAFRRVLAEQVVRDTLQTLAVTTGQYRLRLMPLDPRQHRYIVMLDVTPGFAPRHGGQAWSEREVEELMRRKAHERYALIFEGIYWRAGGGADRGVTSVVTETQRSWQLVSDEEKQALMEAIREGSELPVLHVGELEYQTDLAPLDATGEQAPRTRRLGA